VAQVATRSEIRTVNPRKIEHHVEFFNIEPGCT